MAKLPSHVRLPLCCREMWPQLLGKSATHTHTQTHTHRQETHIHTPFKQIRETDNRCVTARQASAGSSRPSAAEGHRHTHTHTRDIIAYYRHFDSWRLKKDDNVYKWCRERLVDDAFQSFCDADSRRLEGRAAEEISGRIGSRSRFVRRPRSDLTRSLLKERVRCDLKRLKNRLQDPINQVMQGARPKKGR